VRSNSKNQRLVSSALQRIYQRPPADVVRTLAQEARRGAGEHRPPIDPFRIAQALGLPVEERELQAEGVLVDWPGPDCRIILRTIPHRARATLEKRRRFTLAHEIGHFVIRENVRGLIPACRFGVDDPDEERLCNSFAAELLLPRANLASHLEHEGARAKAIVALSEKYRVSLQAFLGQVQSLSGSGFSHGTRAPRFLAAIWAWGSNGYAAEWASPISFRQMILCDSGQSTVEKAFRSPPGTDNSGIDSFLVVGKRTRWRCTSMKLPGSTRVLTTGFRSLGHTLRWAEGSFMHLPPSEVPPFSAQSFLRFSENGSHGTLVTRRGNPIAQASCTSLPLRVAAARIDHCNGGLPPNGSELAETSKAAQLTLWPMGTTRTQGKPPLDWW
jgi:hypothetical protein